MVIFVTNRIDMIGQLIITLVIATLLVLTGRATIRGKCDGFIAGYNTLSAEKKKGYDIKRLRLLVAIFLFVEAALMFILLFRSRLAECIFVIGLLLLIVVILTLANTWAKKK